MSKKTLKTPTVTLDGIEYTAKKPKFGYLRRVAKFEKNNKGAELEDVLDEMEELVCEAFQDENVSPEALEEHLDLDEISPLIKEVMGWALGMFQGKMSEIPNEKSPAEKA